MKQRPHIRYTETQRALMWDRWQQGDSMHEIARLFDPSLPVNDRMPQRLSHWVIIDRIPGEITVFSTLEE
jgi:hypothetical protein